MKINRIVIALFVFSLTALGLPLTAQDVDTTCDQNAVNLAIAAVAKSAQDAQAAADPKAAIDVLATTSATIAALQSECAGLSFTGTSDQVLGPITFPEGIYKVAATMTNYLFANVTILEGTCGQGSGAYLGTNLFIGSQVKAETIFSSSGCSALVEMKASDWSLQFIKIK